MGYGRLGRGSTKKQFWGFLVIISPLQWFIPMLVPLKSHEVSHKLIIAFPILDYPLVNIQKTVENRHFFIFLMGKSTISIAIFNSKLLVYRRVILDKILTALTRLDPILELVRTDVNFQSWNGQITCFSIWQVKHPIMSRWCSHSNLYLDLDFSFNPRFTRVKSHSNPISTLFPHWNLHFKCDFPMKIPSPAISSWPSWPFWSWPWLSQRIPSHSVKNCWKRGMEMLEFCKFHKHNHHHF